MRGRREEHGAHQQNTSRLITGDENDLESALLRSRRSSVSAEISRRCAGCPLMRHTGRPCSRCAGLEELEAHRLVTRNRKMMTITTAGQKAAAHLEMFLRKSLAPRTSAGRALRPSFGHRSQKA